MLHKLLSLLYSKMGHSLGRVHTMRVLPFLGQGLLELALLDLRSRYLVLTYVEGKSSGLPYYWG